MEQSKHSISFFCCIANEAIGIINWIIIVYHKSVFLQRYQYLQHCNNLWLKIYFFNLRALLLGNLNLCMYTLQVLSKQIPKALVTPPRPVIPRTVIFKDVTYCMIFFKRTLTHLMSVYHSTSSTLKKSETILKK